MPSNARSGKYLHLHAYRHRCAAPTHFCPQGLVGFANSHEGAVGIAEAIMKNADG
jgi:hypothetical protein